MNDADRNTNRTHLHCHRTYQGTFYILLYRCVNIDWHWDGKKE